MARATVTYGGFTGDVTFEFEDDTPTPQILAFAQEALRSGQISGLAKDENGDLSDFVVDRSPPNDTRDHVLFLIRPKVPFGAKGYSDNYIHVQVVQSPVNDGLAFSLEPHSAEKLKEHGVTLRAANVFVSKVDRISTKEFESIFLLLTGLPVQAEGDTRLIVSLLSTEVRDTLAGFYTCL